MRTFYRRFGEVPVSQRFVEVHCRSCAVTLQKRKPDLRLWKGNCRSCAQILAKSEPGVRVAQSERAQLQVVRQGGIPNARKFTPGSTAGEKNARWLPDRTKVNPRRSPEYREWRRLVYERDNYTCVMCGVRGGRLNADHIRPWAFFPELRFVLSNGRTLCEPCHRATPTFGAKAYRHKVA